MYWNNRCRPTCWCRSCQRASSQAKYCTRTGHAPLLPRRPATNSSHPRRRRASTLEAAAPDGSTAPHPIEHAQQHVAVEGAALHAFLGHEGVLVQALEDELHDPRQGALVREPQVTPGNVFESIDLAQCRGVVGLAHVVRELQALAAGEPADDAVVDRAALLRRRL